MSTVGAAIMKVAPVSGFITVPDGTTVSAYASASASVNCSRDK